MDHSRYCKDNVWKGHLHAKAIKYDDPILMNNYRKLRNMITSEIEKKNIEHWTFFKHE